VEPDAKPKARPNSLEGGPLLGVPLVRGLVTQKPQLLERRTDVAVNNAGTRQLAQNIDLAVTAGAKPEPMYQVLCQGLAKLPRLEHGYIGIGKDNILCAGSIENKQI
jgi:hypothetical protein